LILIIGINHEFNLSIYNNSTSRINEKHISCDYQIGCNNNKLVVLKLSIYICIVKKYVIDIPSGASIKFQILQTIYEIGSRMLSLATKISAHLCAIIHLHFMRKPQTLRWRSADDYNITRARHKTKLNNNTFAVGNNKQYRIFKVQPF